MVLIVSAQVIIAVIGAKYAQWYFKGSLEELIGLFGEIFEKPTVKKAFSILGKQSGETRHNKAITDQIAVDVLNGPKFSGLKLVAKGLGMDVDEYIEEHGATDTIAGIMSLAQMLGIDINSYDLTALNTPNPNTPTGRSPLRS